MFDVPLMLMSPGMARIVERERRRFFEEEMVPAAVPWDDDRTRFRQNLCVRGETFAQPRLFDVSPLPAAHVLFEPPNAAVSPCGRFVYVVRTLPRGESLKTAQGRMRGRVYFTTDVHVPMLLETVQGRQEPRIWMSLTPMEMLTQRKAVKMARGTVVVGGLGLGWLLDRVCRQPRVKKVILVEKERAVLDWIGPAVRKAYPATERVVECVCGDALKQVGRHGPNATYLLDVWDSYGAAKRDPEFQALKAAHPNVWGWGDD